MIVVEEKGVNRSEDNNDAGCKAFRRRR